MDYGLTLSVNEEKPLFLAVKVIFYGAIEEIIIVQQCSFSEECTTGMVWGLASLKHYGNKV